MWLFIVWIPIHFVNVFLRHSQFEQLQGVMMQNESIRKRIGNVTKCVDGLTLPPEIPVCFTESMSLCTVLRLH